MGFWTGHQLLRRRVVFGDIQLGRPVDVTVDVAGGRVLGFEVRCGDGSHRFLPLAVAQISDSAIELASPLLLLDLGQLAFYRERAATLASLRPNVDDVVFDATGTITELVLRDGTRAPFDAAQLAAERAA